MNVYNYFNFMYTLNRYRKKIKFVKSFVKVTTDEFLHRFSPKISPFLGGAYLFLNLPVVLLDYLLMNLYSMPERVRLWN